MLVQIKIVYQKTLKKENRLNKTLTLLTIRIKKLYEQIDN